MSKLSMAALAAVPLLAGASLGGCAGSSQPSGDGVYAATPNQQTGVNGSGNPGATGPGGAHDSRGGNGWNAGPPSDVGGDHND